MDFWGLRSTPTPALRATSPPARGRGSAAAMPALLQPGFLSPGQGEVRRTPEGPEWGCFENVRPSLPISLQLRLATRNRRPQFRQRFHHLRALETLQPLGVVEI